MNRITRITLNGYKSFRFGEDEATRKDNSIEFGPTTVLLGANGAGKSNIISFFGLLRAMASHPGRIGYFEEYVARKGGAEALLHFGSKETPIMEMEVDVEGTDEVYKKFADQYWKDFHHKCWGDKASPDATPGESFANRMYCGTVRFYASFSTMPPNQLFRRSTGMEFVPKEGGKVEHIAVDQIWPEKPVTGLVNDVWSRLCNDLSFRVGDYQFDDTSERAPIRRPRYQEDSGELLSDAGNLGV